MASSAVSSVAVLIFVAVLYALIISSVLGNSIFTNIDSEGTITNETITGINNVTSSTLGIITTNSGSTCALTALYNSTSGQVIASGNYTFTASGCTIILSDILYNATNVNATYTYSYETNSTTSGVNVTELKSNFGLFITAILSFIVVGGTLIGILWFLKYAKPLLSNKGINSMSA